MLPVYFVTDVPGCSPAETRQLRPGSEMRRPHLHIAQSPRYGTCVNILRRDHPLGTGNPTLDRLNAGRGYLVVAARRQERREADVTEAIDDAPFFQKTSCTEFARPPHRAVNLGIRHELLESPNEVVRPWINPAKVASIKRHRRLLISGTISCTAFSCSRIALSISVGSASSRRRACLDELRNTGQDIASIRLTRSVGRINAYSIASIPPHEWPNKCTRSSSRAEHMVLSSSRNRSTDHNAESCG